MDFVSIAVNEERIAVITFLPAEGDFGDQLHPLHEEVRGALEWIGATEDADAAILTGRGEQFYAGPRLANLAAVLEAHPEEAARIMSDARRIVDAFVQCDKPLIAAVNGPAIGLGCQLAFLSDFCFATEAAWFQDTHTRVGLPAGDGGTLIWPLLFGLNRAKRHLMTGRRLRVEDAVALGAVEEILPAGELIERSHELARRLIGENRLAVRSTKSALNQWLRLGAMTAFEPARQAELAAMLDPGTKPIRERMVERFENREPGAGSAG